MIWWTDYHSPLFPFSKNSMLSYILANLFWMAHLTKCLENTNWNPSRTAYPTQYNPTDHITGYFGWPCHSYSFIFRERDCLCWRTHGLMWDGKGIIQNWIHDTGPLNFAPSSILILLVQRCLTMVSSGLITSVCANTLMSCTRIGIPRFSSISITFISECTTYGKYYEKQLLPYIFLCYNLSYSDKNFSSHSWVGSQHLVYNFHWNLLDQT